jgi:uncharacterized protein (DUF305 family)
MALFSSFIIDPVVRQARRFSGTQQPAGVLAQSHVNRSSPHAPPESDGGHNTNNDTGGLAMGGSRQDAIILEDEDQDQEFIEMPATDHADAVQMSSNPARTIASQLRQLELDSPHSTSASTSTTPAISTAPATTLQEQNAPAMSESLPADDGMRHLRARVHQIRELTISEEEKARMMHGMMTERYNFLRPTSPNSFVSHDRPFTPTSGASVFSDRNVSSPVSAASDWVDPENPFNLRPEDTEPTYRSRPPDHNPYAFDEGEGEGEDEDLDHFEDEVALGCQHYKRNVKVQCVECRRWYTCRYCHDAVEDHCLNRAMTKNMLCMVCGTPQKAGEYCIQCGTQSACYYCDTCKLWDNNITKKIYHCADCGICRRGAGLGKDYVHCKVSAALLLS